MDAHKAFHVSQSIIKEGIVPLIQQDQTAIPAAHVLVGGEGPLAEEFMRLRKKSVDAPMTFVGFINTACYHNT